MCRSSLGAQALDGVIDEGDEEQYRRDAAFLDKRCQCARDASDGSDEANETVANVTERTVVEKVEYRYESDDRPNDPSG